MSDETIKVYDVNGNEINLDDLPVDKNGIVWLGFNVIDKAPDMTFGLAEEPRVVGGNGSGRFLP